MVRGIHEREPVREFIGDHRALSIGLLRKLQQLREQLVAEVAQGGVNNGFIKSFEDYRNHCGKIEGIDIAIGLCKEVQNQLEA